MTDILVQTFQVMWKAVELALGPKFSREKCDVKLVGTPLTHKRFLRRNRGTYGPAIKAGEATFPGQATPIPQLFCCGDSTFPGIGVPAVAASGAIVANTLVSVSQHSELLDAVGIWVADMSLVSKMESPFAIPLHPRDIILNLANGHWNCIKYFMMELFTDNNAWRLSLSPSHAESSCDPLRIMMFLLLKAQLTWAALYSRICELNCWCEALLTRSTNDSSVMRMSRAAIPVGFWVPPLFVTATCFPVAIRLGNSMWLPLLLLVLPHQILKKKVSLFAGRQIVRYGCWVQGTYIHRKVT